MQRDLLNSRKWKTRIKLSREILDWIEAFYNRTCRHSSLGMLSPIAYENFMQNNPVPLEFSQEQLTFQGTY